MHRIAIIGLFLLAGCANEMNASQSAYNTCLSERPVEQCGNEWARFNAAMQAQAVRNTRPPLVLQPWTPPAPVYNQPRTTYATPLGGGHMVYNSY